jgi:hypothetical protein
MFSPHSASPVHRNLSMVTAGGHDLERHEMQAFARPVLRGALRLALAVALTPLAFLAFDLGYRAQLHRPLLALDDWRAARIAYLTFGHRGRFDAGLGWAPRAEYESEGYNTLDLGVRRNFDETELRTGGVLAVGDVFTEGGTEVADGETWPAQLERMTGEPVLNAGVAGYAADQIVLRAEQLLARVQPRTLVVGLFEEAIDRTGHSSFGSSKPYFTLDNGQLVYHAPRKTEADALAGWQGRVRDVLAHSAVLDVVLSRLVPGYWVGKAGEQIFEEVGNDPVGVTCALLERVTKRAAEGGARVVLLLQHARKTVSESTEPEDDAKEVATCAAPLGVQVVDQFQSLRSLAIANPGALNDLYLQGDGYGQMTSAGNWHVADLVARALNK